jgi:low affinity Fe/Cu permease
VTLSDMFNQMTRNASLVAGKPITIAAAFFLVIVWAALGPALGFSDAWQLTINTGTTIITFLMVFIIQNSQNRDALAIQIKLDELLRTQEAAKNVLFDLEELSVEELEEVLQKYEALTATAHKLKREGRGVLPLEVAVARSKRRGGGAKKGASPRSRRAPPREARQTNKA